MYRTSLSGANSQRTQNNLFEALLASSLDIAELAIARKVGASTFSFSISVVGRFALRKHFRRLVTAKIG